MIVPFLIQRFLPFKTGWTFYWFLVVILFVPLTIGYWTLCSKYGKRLNEKVPFPGKPLDHYIDLKSSNLRKYENAKVPMQKFHDAYFDGKVEFKGDVLEIMEYRHDWASFEFTPEVSLADFPRVTALTAAVQIRLHQPHP